MVFGVGKSAPESIPGIIDLKEETDGDGGKVINFNREREIVNFLCIKIAGWKKYNYSTAMAPNGDGRSCK